MAVTMLLEDELDISRGDMICRPTNQPSASRRFEAMVCWFDETSRLRTGVPYQLKHTTRWVAAEVEELRYRLDVDTLHRDLDAETLEVNEIGRVSIHTTSPLFFDEYRLNRTTGSFILVDPAHRSHRRGGDDHRRRRRDAVRTDTSAPVAENITFHPSQALPRGALGGARHRRRDDLDDRPLRLRQVDDRDRGRAHARLQRAPRLHARRRQPAPRPQLRTSASARRTAPRTCAGSARWRKILAESGTVSIVSLVSPYRPSATSVRAAHEEAGIPFFEVFVDTPLEECERRDPKGLYAKARAGEITDLTGVGSPYEAPASPDLVTYPDLEEATRQVLALLP